MEAANWGGLLAVIGLIAAHGLLAAARSAFASARRARLRQMAEEGRASAALTARIAEDSSRMLGTLYLGKALLAVLAAALAALALTEPLAALLAQRLPPAWATALALALIVGCLASAIVTVGRLLPEALAAAAPEGWALRLAWLVYALEIVLWPPVRFLVWISNLLSRSFGGVAMSGTSLITEEEIKTLVDAGEEEGVIEEDEKEMIYSIFQFGDTRAREIMVPRIDMVALDVDTPTDEVIDLIVRAGHSRIPVYEETVDHIVGMLYAKDLLACLGKGEGEVQWRKILRPAYFVPETKKVDDLLREMQQRRTHIAVVVDEYGGTAGLVTVEDILEEIVGEIQDEYDAEEPIFEQVAEGEYVLDARMDLDDVNHMLGTELPTDSADTLGGLIYSILGHIPSSGEQLRIDELSIEVLSVTGRRIRKVRVRQEPLEAEDEAVGS